MRHSRSIWFEACRPRTLPAAAVPVVSASALAYADGGFRILPALIALCFALLVQVGTNFANDYYDAKRGADGPDRVGPRRAVASGLIRPEAMFAAMLAVLCAAFLMGLFLLPYGGWKLLVVGLLSVGFAYAYTGGPYPLAYLGLGDLFVLIFFGWVAVVFSYYVQIGGFSIDTFVLGAGCGLMAANLLVINNCRDCYTDAKAGKRTTTVRFGHLFSVRQYAFSLLIALVFVPLWLFIRGYGPWIFLCSILLIPALKDCVDLSKSKAYQNLLSRTAQRLLQYGAIVSIGLWIA